MPSAVRGYISSGCVVGALRGISIGGPTGINGDASFGRHLACGVRKETVEGNPGAPCLALDVPAMWRFRWAVSAGSRTISVDAKQVSNVVGKRPKLVIKANPDIGVNADVSTAAGAGAGWVTIGPATITPTSDGAVWVELWNTDTDNFSSPAFFDNITTT